MSERGARPTASASRARKITEVDAVVGSRIRLRRGVLGLSAEEVARKLGIAHQQLQKYESAQNRVSAARLFKLAEILDVPVDWFFDKPPAAAELEKGEVRVAATRQPGSDGPPTGEELAEVVRLYAAIPNVETRRHWLEGLRILNRLSATLPR